MWKDTDGRPMFPSLTHDAWEEMVRKSMKGRELEFMGHTTVEGLQMPWRSEPISGPVRGLPERHARGGGEAVWTAQIQQTFTAPESLMQGLMHGVEGVRIPEPQQREPGLVRMLEGVHLEMVAVHLDGFEATGSLRSLVALADGRAITGSCTRDVMRGGIDGERLALHVEAWGAALPAFQTWGVDIAPWIDSGMTPVRALGAAFAALDDAANALEKGGIPLIEAAKHCTIRWGVDSELMAQASLLRAIRWLWKRWLEERGVTPCPVWIEARTTSLRHVWAPAEDNLLRTTAATWAACIGGADGVETLPHDHRQIAAQPALSTGIAAENARRYARNISHLLREESGLHRVWDPLQGSHHAEAWSLLWEERAWEVFQTYRARGGWQTACEQGFVGEQLRASRMDLSRSSQFLPADSALPPDAGVGGEVPERAPWFLADTLLHSRDTHVPR